MRKLLAVAAVIFIVTITLGCLGQVREDPSVSAAATSTLKITTPAVVNRGEYAAFTCQLNMTHGSGLDNKEIRWTIDNVFKGTSRTMWGFAAFNLTMDQTNNLKIGKHVITATFDGDDDYAGSNASATFSVQSAATPTPSTTTARPENIKASISLSVPSAVSRGSAYLTGMYSGMGRNQYLYVLVKPAGSNAWKVQSAPITYLNGTYGVYVSFETSGNQDLLALISNSTLKSGSSINTLPNTLAESRVSTTVK
jgi:hypothetical protein